MAEKVREVLDSDYKGASLKLLLALLSVTFVSYCLYEIQSLKVIVQKQQQCVSVIEVKGNNSDGRVLKPVVAADTYYSARHLLKEVIKASKRAINRDAVQPRLNSSISQLRNDVGQQDNGQQRIANRGTGTFMVPPTDNTGSVYVRWGKFGCGGSSDGILYSGYAAAAPTIKGFGGSTEILCLPLNREHHSKLTSNISSRILLNAVKLNLGAHTSLFPLSAHEAILECAVCSTRRASTVMIPGWYSKCPSSWTKEYSGYLMSTPGISRRYYFGSKSYCVDENPDTAYKAMGSTKRLQLTFVQTGQCTSGEPCTDYKARDLIGCTVCSRPS